jgi:class 3 adenylate cyclase/tetratricopeptide (TPR) repeat protein
MRCPRCQQEVPADADFCPECGAKLAAVCAGCGTVNAPTHKFCKKCGQGLRAGAGGSQAEVPSMSPSSYTPKRLAEKILTSKAALEGERKQVTVLFADLKGSMELLADRDPEEARRLLDPVLEHMMEAVHRYEGTVNQVMGDGIMALFGAPLAHEDHAVRACYAALRMQDSVKRYSEEARRSHGVEVNIRVGLNSGEVVVRSIGSDLHMDYTAVGQTTHLAARMEQLAAPGTIRLTADTLRLAEGYVEVKPLGPVPIKGLSTAAEIFELTGAGVVRSRLQAATARGLTRFVGRNTEVEQLRKALEQSHGGHGQLVATVGEPGVGKSRLFQEFTHSHRVQDWLILQSASVSYGKASSYLPVIDLLKAYFKLHDREAHREIREKVTGKLLTLDRALEPTLPGLLTLLDVPVQDAPWQALDPAQRRQRTLDAVKRLLLRESQLQPVLVLFEDLHWIDSETQAFLDSLVESLPAARLLLLVNYRPEYKHGWGSKTYYTQLRLDALPPESAAQLLLAMLGADATIEPLKPVLIGRTGGNPLFLEESVRALVETNALTGERGAYRLARALGTIEVPATVQAILAARIDRLAPEDKQLLQTASVVGKDVPFSLLLAIAELAEDDLRHGLARLQVAEFLYEAQLFPDLEYTFKHALTHEVAYGGLLADRKRLLHSRVVAAIVQLHGEDLAEYADPLAHHAFAGELWEGAVQYLQLAARRASLRAAHLQAADCLERALVAARHLPRRVGGDGLTIDLHLAARSCLQALGVLSRIEPHLREAKRLAEASSDSRREARVAGAMTNYLLTRGEYAAAVEEGDRALTLAHRSDDTASLVPSRFYLAQASFMVGDFRRAADLLDANLRIPASELPRNFFGDPPGNSAAWLGATFAEMGDFERGLGIVSSGASVFAASGHALARTNTLWALGLLHARRGAFDRAIRELEKGTEICRTEEVHLWYPILTATLGWALARAGRFDEGLALLREGGWATSHAWHRLWLSEALLCSGKADEARQLAEQLVPECRSKQIRGVEAQALWLTAEAAARLADIRGASEYYISALALAETLEVRPLVARCHAGLVIACRRAGERQQAEDHFTTAVSMYREMGMTYWLEKAEAEMRDLG